MKKFFVSLILLLVSASALAVVEGNFYRWGSSGVSSSGSSGTSVLHFRATHLSGFGSITNFCLPTDMDTNTTGFVDCSAAGNIGSTVDHAGYALDGTVTLNRLVCSLGIVGTWSAGDQLTLQFGTVNVSTAAFTAAAGTSFQMTPTGGGGDVEVPAAGDFGFAIDLGGADVTVAGASTPPTILSLRVTSATDADNGADWVGNCSLEQVYTPN